MGEIITQITKRTAIFLLTVVSLSIFSFQSDAQNYALDFDGTDDVVNFGNDASLDLTGDHTISLWLNIPSGKPNNIYAFFISKRDGINGNYQFYARTQSYSPTYEIAYWNSNVGVINSGLSCVEDKWQHLAVVVTDTEIKFYINGIQEKTMSVSNGHGPQVSGADLLLGLTEGDPMMGIADEVRLWNTALTSTQIRNWMHKEVTGSHSNYSDLVAYYKMSDGSGTSLTDNSSNSNSGTLQNGPTWIDPSTTSNSASPLGTESDFSLADSDIGNVSTSGVSTNTDVEIDISNVTSATSYSYSAIRFNSAPDVTAGLTHSPDSYWELWANEEDFDNSFSATVQFHYDNLNISDESSLLLYQREKVGDSWTVVTTSYTVEDGASTSDGIGYISLTITESTLADFGSQYIISSNADDNPFPVEMGEITADRISEGVEINWLTFSELNNDYFEVQRSQNGEDFIAIAKVSGNGTTSEISQYSFVDQNAEENIDYYYRLKQVDYDGQNTESDVIFVPAANELDVTVYPTVANDRINFAVNKAAEIQVYNMQGALVKQFGTTGSTQISISDMPDGMYFYQVATNTERYSGKFVKK